MPTVLEPDPLSAAVERCAAEPIHAPGAVQPFAALLAVDAAGETVTHCSANAASVLGRDAAAVLGRPLADALPAAGAAAVVRALAAVPTHAGDREVVVHRSPGGGIAEFIGAAPNVPAGAPLPDGGAAQAVARLAGLLAAGGDTDAFCRAAAEELRSLTGYDRVMVYRFDADWNGAVVAESCAAGVDAYLGHHFPASDIPPQARALYLRVPVRVLADAAADPVPLLPAGGPPLDLSLAVARALSPVHREYLRNMGVRGTLVASVVSGGALWGLVTCHHVGPLQPPPPWLALAGAVAQMVAAQVAAERAGARARGVASAQRLLAALPQLLAGPGRLGDGLVDPRLRLMEAVAATGLAVRHQGRWFARGAVPDAADLGRLAGWLDGVGQNTVATDRLGEVAPGLEHLSGTAPGLLAIRVPNTADGWVVWFRAEYPATVTWAGDYRKGLSVDGKAVRLGPRTSFKAWVAEARGRARPWGAADLAVVDEVVRPTLLEAMAGAFQEQAVALRRYQTILFEQVHDVVVVTDLDGVITFWNAGAERTLGWRPDETVGRHVLWRVPEASLPKARELLAAVLAGAAYSGQYRDAHKDGREVWLDVRLCRIRDDAGRPAGVMGAARDVTGEKVTADLLRMKQAIVRNSRDAVLVAAAGPRDFADLRVVYANPAFAAETGFAGDGVLGRPLREFVAPPAAAAARIAACGAGREACREEVRCPRAGGGVFWAEADLTPLYDAAGEHVHWVVVLRNVTERKAAEATLRASEERTRLALESGRMGLYDRDLVTGRIVWSPRQYEIFGYRPGSAFPVEYRHFADRVHPDDRAELERRLAAARAAVAEFRHEFRVVWPDGAVRWVSTAGRFYPDAAGAAARLVGTVRDVTARKEAEARLAEREQFLAALFEGSPVGIEVYAPDGTVLQRNRGMQALLGLPAAGCDLGRYNLLADPVLRGGPVPAAFARALGGEAVALDEYPLDLTSPDNARPTARRHLWLDSTLFALPGGGGRPDRVVVFTLDATARVTARAEKDILASATQQAQKLDAIGQLAGGIAHDFNNVLTGIRVFADLLLDDLAAGDPSRRLAEEVRKAADRGANLTRRLLAFSRKQPVRPAVVDAGALVADMCEMLCRLIGEGVAVTTALDPAAPRVLADPGQLEQVVLNLALNARDAMPAGGRLAVATAGVAAADLPPAARGGPPAPVYLRLRVSDTGTGMSDEVRARLFEPFFSTKEPGKGTGLGLATVYGIVRQADGFVTVDTRVGGGTTFDVYLPAAVAPQVAEPVAAAPRVTPAGRRVLVVDDDPMILRLAQSVLGDAGYEVATAGGAAAAIELVESGLEVDYLLTDVVMPGLSGPDLVARLADRRPGMRAALMSGLAGDALSSRGVNAETGALLQKPFSAAELIRFVRALGVP